MSYEYDLAISFAGEQRGLAHTLAHRLDAAGYAIFYDEFKQAELWGRDLSVTLSAVYSRAARYCLIILSNAYLEKPWTKHERRSAIEEFIQRRSEFILCLKVEDVELPGYSSLYGYISMAQFDVDAVYKLLVKKLGTPDHENQISHLNSSDRTLARQVIAACFRRAIYTRMDSEIDLRAMYDSIGKAIGEVQNITPRIQDHALQYSCLEIIRALDEIERVRTRSDAWVSNSLSPTLRTYIDQQKLVIVKLLLEIRRAADIPIQLPFALRTDHFFRLEQADEQPKQDVA
jgi:hypothetical protein